LRFLVDENLGKSIVKGLRERGFTVQSVAEEIRGASDEEVVDLAKRHGKIIVTQDKDFGRLVIAFGVPGLILLRVRGRQEKLLRVLLDLLQRVQEFHGYITVVEEDRIRRRKL